MKLTGHQRLQLTTLWIKRGMEGDKEKFIQKVCDLKCIEYTPPKKIKRYGIITVWNGKIYTTPRVKWNLKEDGTELRLALAQMKYKTSLTRRVYLAW